jgi:ethanolamine utilization protein EutQ
MTTGELMAQGPQGIRLFTPQAAEAWHQSEDRQVFLSDVVDARNGDTMSVGFARYGPGESNEWVVTYDEALIVTRGAYSVASADGVKTTARTGEVIFLDKGTTVVYSAEEDGADVVYVTYPHWVDAQEKSAHAAFLDTFHPVENGPPPASARELLQGIFGPMERGEADGDSPAFLDALADDAVFELAAGELRGKQAIGHYLGGGETMEFDPFKRPLEYFGDGDRVVILGDEDLTVRSTGVTRRAEWAWVVDVRDGLITHISEIQDISGVADEIGSLIAEAQAGHVRAA